MTTLLHTFIYSLIIVTIVKSHPLYFTIDHHARCLYEEVTKDTLFKLDFILNDPIPLDNLADPSLQNTYGARIVIYDPKEVAVLYKLSLYNQTGKLSFFSELDGEYRICFEINASVNRKLKFLINLNVGDDEFSDDKKTTVQTQTNILGAKVKKFIHHARQFRKVQKMNKGQDKIIFEAQESLNTKIILSTIIQITVLIGSGIFQIFSLRRFLIKRKLY